MNRENDTTHSSSHDVPRWDTGVGDPSAPGPIPLINKFRTDQGRYAYDGNTSAILKLDQITFELLDFIGSCPKGEVPGSLVRRFPPDEIARSLSRLEALLEESGVFRPVSIKSRLVSPTFVVQNWRRIAGKFDQLTLEVTENCNMRCRYCSYSAGFKDVRIPSQLMMPWDTARKAIDFFLRNPLRQLPYQYIGFWGGEPLMNIELIKRCVEYVRSRDSSTKFGLITNGTLLSERVRRFLVAHDFKLDVSLDGPSEIHDQNRIFAGGKGSFGTIMRNLRALKESAPEYYMKKIRFISIISPGVDFRKLLDFFSNASDLIGLGTVSAFLVEQGPKTFFTPSLQAEFYNGLKALERVYLQKVIKGDRSDGEFAFLRALFQGPYLSIHRRRVNPKGWGETFHTMGACFPGNHELLVRTNGKFLICEKSSDALEIGDVERGLDGKKICEFYRAHHDLHQTECRRCWALRLCAPCYVSDTRRTGSFGARLNPEDCEAQRQFWTEKLTNYASVLEQNAGAFDHLNEVAIVRTRIPLLDSEPSDSNEGVEIDQEGEAGCGDGGMQGMT
jgi:uncharacterized protein